MAKAINNVVTASKNLINIAGSTVQVGSEVVVDGSELLNSTVKSAPAVVKALLASPFAAAKGYIMEAEGVSEEEAEERAYKYARQDLSRTIEDAGTGAGKLLAELLKEDLDGVDNVTTEQLMLKTKAELAKMLADVRS